MDVLALLVESGSDPDAAYATVRVVVNGRDLVDYVRDYERAFAGQLAGKYGQLPAGDVLLPHRHFFGGSDPMYHGLQGRTMLLACECGEPGCWPFEARITMEDHVVRWSDFCQPHRSEWSYTTFGPFTFDRAEYEEAVTVAAARFRVAEA